MRKIIIALVLFIGLSQVLLAQNSEPSTMNPNAAVLTLDKEDHDYGTMYQNSNGTTNFVYTNNGHEPLLFSRVKSSCGCTVPKWSRQPLMPGQTDTLKVIYDTKRLGSFHKSITIESNATEGRVVLKIKGKVIPEPSDAMPTKYMDNEMSPINK